MLLIFYHFNRFSKVSFSHAQFKSQAPCLICSDFLFQKNGAFSSFAKQFLCLDLSKTVISCLSNTTKLGMLATTLSRYPSSSSKGFPARVSLSRNANFDKIASWLSRLLRLLFHKFKTFKNLNFCKLPSNVRIKLFSQWNSKTLKD